MLKFQAVLEPPCHAVQRQGAHRQANEAAPRLDLLPLDTFDRLLERDPL